MDKKEMLEHFNKKFDTDISRRLRKFREEYEEFLHAYAFEDKESQVDELADMTGVLFHIAGIYGYSLDDLLEMVWDKVKGREIDPNYKRKHPHVKNNGAE